MIKLMYEEMIVNYASTYKRGQFLLTEAGCSADSSSDFELCLKWLHSPKSQMFSNILLSVEWIIFTVRYFGLTSQVWKKYSIYYILLCKITNNLPLLLSWVQVLTHLGFPWWNEFVFWSFSVMMAHWHQLSWKKEHSSWCDTN